MIATHKTPRIGWMGFHMEGLPAITALLEQKVPIQAVITLKRERLIKRSGYVNYVSLCKPYNVPVFEIENINDEESIALLNDLSLDIVFVIGWSQIVRQEALKLARVGMIGAHASLLPRNRGSAPINWALIHNETMTGNSLIWLDEEVDTGYLIDQMEFQISWFDTCATLYEKVAHTNKEMILRLIPRLFNGEKPGYPQTHSGEPILPRRRPKDGLIDWAKDHISVYNFVRALTRPYPGAFSFLDGKRWNIWKCGLLPGEFSLSEPPGTIVGAVFSPEENACGQVVACGRGAIILLELEGEEGEILSGYALSEQNWKGARWIHE